MTALQRIDAIYEELKGLSPNVRRSMLLYHCLPSVENDLDPVSCLPRERSVLWITTAHPFLPILEHNLAGGHFGRDAMMHRSHIEGIAVRGIYAHHFEGVADLVWAEFLKDTERYLVYEEDGTRIVREVTRRDDPEPEPEQDKINEQPADDDGPVGGTDVVIDMAPVVGRTPASAATTMVIIDDNAYQLPQKPKAE